MSDNSINMEQALPAGLLRRIGAIFYDSLLVTALVFVCFAAVYIPLEMGLGIKDTQGHPLWTLYILFIIVGFHLWFWTHGGQTLGMRVWRIKLFNDEGGSVSYKQALVRYLVAILSVLPVGLGFIWALFDENKRTWHDIASHTRLVVIKKR